MIKSQKLHYVAPELSSIEVNTEDLFCNDSTGERFSGPTDYSGGWEEED